MKRRELKKRINLLCGELFAECVSLLHYQQAVPMEDVDNVMRSVLLMQDDLICRCSHVEPGNTKLFFKKLNDDLRTTTEEIVEQIMALA